jgi:3-oxoacyl-[acyl-carrier protein] reductase
VGFAKTLSNELAPHNISVNNVCPGFTTTDRLDHLAAQIGDRKGLTKETVINSWKNSIPMGRLGRPEEFAALVAFLASERAGYITGTTIPIDGGAVKGMQ